MSKLDQYTLKNLNFWETVWQTMMQSWYSRRFSREFLYHSCNAFLLQLDLQFKVPGHMHCSYRFSERHSHKNDDGRISVERVRWSRGGETVAATSRSSSSAQHRSTATRGLETDRRTDHPRPLHKTRLKFLQMLSQSLSASKRKKEVVPLPVNCALSERLCTGCTGRKMERFSTTWIIKRAVSQLQNRCHQKPNFNNDLICLLFSGYLFS